MLQLPRRARLLRLRARCLTTVTSEPSKATDGLPPPAPSKPKVTRPRPLSPWPRGLPPGFPVLPPTFGRNQMLSVPDSTRALLEEIVSSFNAPIRYAFAYGSGVFDQHGYPRGETGEGRPMIDFLFAVTHAAHWHSINLNQNPTHYPLHARWLGSDFVSSVQVVAPGMWFNAYVPYKDVTIKYGVTTVDNLCADLLYWRSLYMAGRMHKPIRIIRDDARVRLTQQVNLTSAVRVALATLPAEFTERELFERIAGLSYSGDLRMRLPGENRSKVANIASAQGPQFKELYHRLAVGLPGVHWPLNSNRVQQDTSPTARAALVRKLPSTLRARVEATYSRSADTPSKESDEAAFYARIGADAQLGPVVQREVANIVSSPATMQTVKGIVSAGPGKSIKYVTSKIGKWWRGS
ncbi:Mmp37-domain-containing protein [Exidia glandulosa HHB12029]|uniref:Phosphatidate cytidylyltransferase, mitochondrial n=2 Tax=Exidia glandulosa HHB12029 TaxID=1314781 RepID=A0A165GYZ4_EXIGL|nr:Mmp37-domain-containing protein [Exidia glandulosa HHB12029]